MGSNLAQTMEQSIVSKCLGIYVVERALLPFAPETSGVELAAPFLETTQPTRQEDYYFWVRTPRLFTVTNPAQTK